MSDLASRRSSWFGGKRAAALSGGVIVLLAVGSLLFPAHQSLGSRGVLLVFDPGCFPERQTTFYEPLARFMGDAGDLRLEVSVVRDQAAFDQQLAQGPDYVLCPDGVGLELPTSTFLPLVVGRRAAPRNLRPRSVLVYRKDKGLVATPWLDYPEATIIGDSLSLVGTGPWRRHEPMAAPLQGAAGPAYGPDPFDHSPALHALRLGCFDFAVVRQWDADRFFAAGLLTHLEWGLEVLSPPAPDLMLFAARKVSQQRRLVLSDRLSALGRNQEGQDARESDLVAGLSRLQLVGFNLLVEPDFELVHRNFPGHWPDQSP